MLITKLFKEYRLLHVQCKKLSSIPSTLLVRYSPSSTTTQSAQRTDLIHSYDLEIPKNLENSPISRKNKSPSVFDNIDRPNAPTFLTPHIDVLKTLQKLQELGVDLGKIEKKTGIGQFVIKLEFDKHIKDHLDFLNGLGIGPDKLGAFITKNPLIFKEDLDNLQVRINYLESKRFKPSEISRIVEVNPFWLMFSTKRIDNRLGHFQKAFHLVGAEVRRLAIKSPKLITYSMEAILKNTFSIHEEMGFDKHETKELLLNAPKLWMLRQDDLLERFVYVHRTINIPHNQIILTPKVLYSRQFRIKERHEYLVSLNRAQYDPTKDLYVSLETMVQGDNTEFAVNVARSTVEHFEDFLRTR